MSSTGLLQPDLAGCAPPSDTADPTSVRVRVPTAEHLLYTWWHQGFRVFFLVVRPTVAARSCGGTRVLPVTDGSRTGSGASSGLSPYGPRPTIDQSMASSRPDEAVGAKQCRCMATGHAARGHPAQLLCRDAAQHREQIRHTVGHHCAAVPAGYPCEARWLDRMDPGAQHRGHHGRGTPGPAQTARSPPTQQPPRSTSAAPRRSCASSATEFVVSVSPALPASRTRHRPCAPNGLEFMAELAENPVAGCPTRNPRPRRPPDATGGGPRA